MNKVTCKLENCYGIQSFKHEFDFMNTNAICIYARNGMMKTSFSKTFKKIQEKKIKEVKDEIFNIDGTIDVKVDGKPIAPENVFVINSFETFYESSSIASLLVNDDIKKRISSVLKLKDRFLKTLEKKSGLKISKVSLGKKVYELETQIVKDFQFQEDSFLLNIKLLEAMGSPTFICDDVKYNSVFDDTALKKINSKDFQEKIEVFCLVSDRIYAEYDFLDKGKFTLPKLKNIHKLLENDSFFVKDNSLYLGGGYTIKQSQELQQKITEVEEKIKVDPVFQDIEKALSDSKGIILKDLLENNPGIIPYLKVDKLDELKKELWLSYIWAEKETFKALVDEYKVLEKEISSIDLDTTPWKKALDIFEERFTVPYKMEISNMTGSIIGESIPRVEFSFKRDDTVVKMTRSALEGIDVLSQGEKRALYLLNIIFDIERIKKSGEEVLFIVDDIADSFDYKNKYAIVEYLYEMALENKFRLLILSHNFDFYRTVSTRLSLSRENRLSAELVGRCIVLREEKYQNQPFLFWKKNLDLVNVIALIPFVRNIVEYCEDKNVGDVLGIDKDFLLLTHLLHEKDKTNVITFDTLKPIYKTYLGKDDFKSDITGSDLVINKIYSVADDINRNNAELEHKIILAIAIRHKAEIYMFDEIKKYSGKLSWKVKNNIKIGSVQEFKEFLDTASNQTRELFGAFKQFGGEDKVKLLEEVNIMTPENIHLNSFMYEPILDMDIDELLHLYQKVKAM